VLTPARVAAVKAAVAANATGDAAVSLAQLLEHAAWVKTQPPVPHGVPGPSGILMQVRYALELNGPGTAVFSELRSLRHQIERLPDARQHPQSEHVDFQNAERVEIVLIPFDESALRHRAIADRHHLVEPAAGDDETADMLRQMTREADDFARQRRDLPDAAAVQIEPGARKIGAAAVTVRETDLSTCIR
jgi:hypothetical protein